MNGLMELSKSLSKYISRSMYANEFMQETDLRNTALLRTELRPKSIHKSIYKTLTNWIAIVYRVMHAREKGKS